MVSTSTLRKQLNTGDMLVMTELSPPMEASPAFIREQARKLKGKVHAIGLSDNREGIGISAIAAATLVDAEGVVPVVHMATRDRNRIALVSDFLGANALGLTNILCTTGTHQTLGTFKAAKNVFDVDSVQLLKLLSSQSVSNGSVLLGATASPFADPAALQMIRLAKKAKAGARFIVTQPIFDLKRFDAWWQEVKQNELHEQCAFILGIHPLLGRDASATFAGRRPNPCIPEALLKKITDAPDDAAARKAGIEIATTLISELKSVDGIRGFEIFAGDDIDAVLTILDNAGLEIS
jgi:methylenetetrahydrofolate reductase (NADPH)